MEPKPLSKKAFFKLSETEKLNYIKRLNEGYEAEKVIDLLKKANTLSPLLTKELARAYNNNEAYRLALKALESLPEESHDALWHYRYAYSHLRLFEKREADFESHRKNALTHFEKAIEIAQSPKYICWSLEQIEYSNLLKHLTKESYSLLYAHAKKERERKALALLREVKPYKKITLAEIKGATSSFEIIAPVFSSVNIEDGYTVYLASLLPFSLEQKYLNALTWYEVEAKDGGHLHYLTHSSGLVWEDVLVGYQHFGLPNLAKNFQKLVDFLGGTLPYDSDERSDFIGEILKEKEKAFKALLLEVDTFLLAQDSETALLSYLKSHPKAFLYDGL